MLFLVGPLYMTHGYRDIISAKTYIVWLSIILTGVVGSCSLLKEKREPGESGSITIYRRIRLLQASCELSDVLIAAFGLWALISALCSPWRKQALTGEAGWNVGALLIVALTVLYFAVSRSMLREELFPIYMLMLGGSLVMALGILNDLGLDPLGVYRGVEEPLKDIFISTIGNVDQYSGYLSMVIPAALMLFVADGGGGRSRVVNLLTGGTVLLGFLNIFLTHADSIYLGAGSGAAIAVWYCLYDHRRIRRLLAAGLLFAAAGSVAALLTGIFPDIHQDGISSVLLKKNIHITVGAVSALLLIISFRVFGGDGRREIPAGTVSALAHTVPHTKSCGQSQIINCRYQRRIYIVLLGICVAAAAGYVVLNFGPMLFNGRGLIWMIVYRVMSGSGDTGRLILGLGPGCLDFRAEDHAHLMVQYFGDIYELSNAHNDIIEYLATTGIPGGIIYAGIYVSVLAEGCRRVFGISPVPPADTRKFADEGRKPEDHLCSPSAGTGRSVTALACTLGGLAGYMAQSMLNGPHPLNFALFYCLMALCRGLRRK